jgi:hypothetical protein
MAKIDVLKKNYERSRKEFELALGKYLTELSDNMAADEYEEEAVQILESIDESIHVLMNL